MVLGFFVTYELDGFLPLLFGSSIRERTLTASSPCTLCRVHSGAGCAPWRFAEVWMSHLCWNCRRWSADCGNLRAEEMGTYKLYVQVTEATGAKPLCGGDFFLIISHIRWLTHPLNSTCKQPRGNSFLISTKACSPKLSLFGRHRGVFQVECLAIQLLLVPLLPCLWPWFSVGFKSGV